MKTLLPVLYLVNLFLEISYATMSSNDEVTTFRPFMLGHKIEGCPENSLCSKETGALKLQWFHLLKEGKISLLKAFKKNHGIPISLWTTRKQQKGKHIVIWDSPCLNHRKDNEEIYESEIFLKNFQELSIGPILIGKKIFVLLDNKKVSYIAPMKELPLFIKNRKLYFHKEENGRYYSFSVSPRGNIGIEHYTSPDHFPQTIECPEILKKGFLTSFSPKHLYVGERCKNLWDMKRKSFVPIIYGWSCPQ